MNIFLIFTVVFLTFTCVHGIDEDSAKEQSCFPIEKTVAVNESWSAPSKMYYPLMSRLGLYRMARGLSGRRYEDISESDLYYNSCIYFTERESTPNLSIAHGFGGKSLKMYIKMLDKTFEKFEFFTGAGKKGYTGTCWVVMTDNETYIVSACCTNGNQMIWDMSATVKKLPKKTVQKIHQHMISIGFKKEYFTQLKYNSC